MWSPPGRFRVEVIDMGLQSGRAFREHSIRLAQFLDVQLESGETVFELEGFRAVCCGGGLDATTAGSMPVVFFAHV